MAESQKAKANRLEKAREQRRVKREQTGDTAEAKAERRKQSKEYDADEDEEACRQPRRCFVELIGGWRLGTAFGSQASACAC